MPPIAVLPKADVGPFTDTQPFEKIMSALGRAQTLRKNRILRKQVMQAISMGAGPEDIAAIVNKPVPYSPGVMGVFERIGDMFGPKTTPIEEQVAKNVIEQYFQSGRIGTLPGWWPYATPQQRQDYMNRVGGPLVQVGQKLLTEEQRQDIAEKDYKEKMGMSASEKDLARKSVKTIIKQMSPSKMRLIPGARNFRQDQLIEAYKQYQKENDYSTKSQENRKWLDELWDGQIHTYNKSGFEGHGTEEFKWNPEDERVKKLREQTKIDLPAPTNENEKQAYNMIYDVWDFLPKNVQDAIKLRRQMKESYTNIINYDEISSAIKRKTR